MNKDASPLRKLLALHAYSHMMREYESEVAEVFNEITAFFGNEVDQVPVRVRVRMLRAVAARTASHYYMTASLGTPEDQEAFVAYTSALHELAKLQKQGLTDLSDCETFQRAKEAGNNAKDEEARAVWTRLFSGEPLE